MRKDKLNHLSWQHPVFGKPVTEVLLKQKVQKQVWQIKCESANASTERLKYPFQAHFLAAQDTA